MLAVAYNLTFEDRAAERARHIMEQIQTTIKRRLICGKNPSINVNVK